MRTTSMLVATIAIAVCGACSAGDSEQITSDRTSASRTATASVPTPTFTEPEPENTYARAPGDPRKHTFEVTIHDVLPLDAYTVDGDRCVTTAVPQQAPHALGFSGPSKHFENRPLAQTFEIPTTARLLSDGTCESTMQATVPYRPRYEVGVIIEGRGISSPTDPQNPTIITSGDRQTITTLR